MKKTYATIRNDLQTGDIVLFSGGSLFSKAIKWFTSSEWSHVGMVIRSKEWDMVLLWESTTPTELKDVETGLPANGVQLVPLSEKISHYAKVAVRHLQVERSKEMVKKLIEFRKEMKQRKYDFDALELVRSAVDGVFFGDNQEDLSSLFCSELIAESYQRMGLLSEDLPSNEYTPKDFSDKGQVKLLGGAKLTEQIYLA